VTSEEVWAGIAETELASRPDVTAGTGFGKSDPGHGRLMKEWAVMPEAAAGEWPALVGEARSYVDPGGRSRRSPNQLGPHARDAQPPNADSPVSA
jgi:hypothetical protein